MEESILYYRIWGTIFISHVHEVHSVPFSLLFIGMLVKETSNAIKAYYWRLSFPQMFFIKRLLLLKTNRAENLIWHTDGSWQGLLRKREHAQVTRTCLKIHANHHKKKKNKNKLLIWMYQIPIKDFYNLIHTDKYITLGQYNKKSNLTRH